jgi:hypothetical protein
MRTLNYFLSRLRQAELSHAPLVRTTRDSQTHVQALLEGHVIQREGQDDVFINPIDSPFSAAWHFDLNAHWRSTGADKQPSGFGHLESRWEDGGEDVIDDVELALRQKINRRVMEFESRLHETRQLSAIGRRILQMPEHARHAAVQLIVGNRVVAWVSFEHWMVAVGRLSLASTIRKATLVPVSAQDFDAPADFKGVSLSQVMWRAVQHTGREDLDPSWHHRTLIYGKTPKLPRPWMKARHTDLLQSLSRFPMSYQQLLERYPENAQTLQQDIVGFLWAGAVRVLDAQPTPRHAALPC